MTEQQDVLEDVERLRRLVSQLMLPNRLTAEQRAGSVCAWCRGKPGPAATELDAFGMTPRGCSTCYWARYNWLTTWHDWQAHVAGCVHCRAGSMCWGSHGCRTAHEETITDAGQPEPVCGACEELILPTERAVPHLWVDESGPGVAGYVHCRCRTEQGAGRGR